MEMRERMRRPVKAMAGLWFVFALAAAALAAPGSGPWIKSSVAMAAGPGMKWEDFKTEYAKLLEEDKSGASQSLRLTGDLTVEEDFALNQTKGNLTLEAGSYSIRVEGGKTLRLSNSNLTVQGSGAPDPLIVLNGGALLLEQGNLNLSGRGALLLESGTFKLDAPSNGFRIQCSAGAGGRDPYVIVSKLSGPITMRGLTLNAEGGILGIQTKGDLRLEWCRISAKQPNQPVASSQSGTVTLSASQVSPSPGGGGSLVEEKKDAIESILKPDPCFLIGNTEKSQAKDKLAGQVTAVVRTVTGAQKTMQLPVIWNLNPLPDPIIYGGNAYVLEGRIPESGLMQAEVVNPKNAGTTLNVLAVKHGAIEDLYGTGKWKASGQVEVELWLPCPDTATELYVEYSTDQQVWKVDQETITDANGKEEQTDNLWRVLTGSADGKAAPSMVRSDGRIKLVCSLDLTQNQAVKGFWVRVRLSASEYAGTSNACRFHLKAVQNQNGGLSTWSLQSDTGGTGNTGEGDFRSQTGETEPESAEETGQEEPDVKSKKSGGGSGGAGPEESETPPGGADTPSDPEETPGGGHSVSYGRRRGFRRGGGGTTQGMEGEAAKEIGWVPFAVAGAAILALILVLYRKWRKKFM